MALEDRIKEARKNNGLTQQQAAGLIGVAKSTWAGYESGNSTPDIDKIVKIMDVLNVDANYLWQDYNQEEQKNAPAPEGTEAKEMIPLSETTDLLVDLGYIRRGQQLTDADLAFLTNVVGLLDAWFSRNRA